MRSSLKRRPCERKVDGTAWSWNPWLLREGMTERGTTGAGEPPITGVPRVHRTLEQNGCDTMGSNIRLGYNGIYPFDVTSNDPRPVTNGAKLSHHGTKSRLDWRLACWIHRRRDRRPVSRRTLDQMSLGQQLRRRKLRSTSHRKRIRSRRYREMVLCKRKFLHIINSLGPKGWRSARKMRLPNSRGARHGQWCTRVC